MSLVRVQSPEFRVQSFKDLKVWQRSRVLVKTIYALTEDFPKEELYGLSNQLRRCAVSIPSNIAEGSSKHSTREFIRYLNMAHGSLAEMETQIILAQDLGYLCSDALKTITIEIQEIGKMINGLIVSLERRLKAELTEL